MKVRDRPTAAGLLVHVAFPSLGSNWLSVCQLACKRPIENRPRGVTRDSDREVVWAQAALGERFLQKVDVQSIPDAVPALEPAEWRDHGNILILQPDVGGEFEIRRPDRFKVLLQDLLDVVFFLVNAGRAMESR